jgi:hypothetical protein
VQKQARSGGRGRRAAEAGSRWPASSGAAATGAEAARNRERRRRGIGSTRRRQLSGGRLVGRRAAAGWVGGDRL